eukprot:jgi/Hompol1/3127/HPOL_006339-RA
MAKEGQRKGRGGGAAGNPAGFATRFDRRTRLGAQPDTRSCDSRAIAMSFTSLVALIVFCAAVVQAQCHYAAYRFEWRELTAQQQKQFLDAITCLKGRPSIMDASAHSSSRFDDFVYTHQALSPLIHSS